MQSNNIGELLPEAVAEVLGRGIAEARREWQQELRLIVAESQRLISESRSETAAARAEAAELRAHLKEVTNEQIRRVDQALLAVRNGERGPEGPAGKDADPIEIKRLIDEALENEWGTLKLAISDAVEDLPRPVNGERGEKGEPGVGIETLERRGDDLAFVLTNGTERVFKNIRGPVGEKGEKGDPGAVGERGEKGEPGEKGLSGEKGEKGDPGAPGATGERGPQGDMGPAGLRGEKGDPGAPGRDGLDGAKGDSGPQGEPGKDADPELVQQLIERAVAALPKPKDGVRGPEGPVGPAGKDADPVVIKAMVAEAAAEIPERVRRAAIEAVEALPKPKDGKDGTPGKDGVGIVAARQKGDDVILELSDGAEAVFKNLRGEPGPAGPEGKPGAPGVGIAKTKRVGADLVLVMSDGDEHVVSDVRGPRGEKGERGEGVPGRDGRDGVGIQGERGPEGPAGRSIQGEKGEKGDPGEPGLGFEDFEAEWTNERELVLKWARGSHVHEVKKRFPVLLYRDIYKPDTNYEKGDVVTFGGSAWIAMRDTSDKPGTSDAWKLAVKHGRDGRDAK